MSTVTIVNASLPLPSSGDLIAIWIYLQAGVNQILTGSAVLDMQTYLGMITAVFNYCTSYKAVTREPYTGQLRIEEVRDAHLGGRELYLELVRALKSHLRGLLELSQTYEDDMLPAFYVRKWDEFTKAAKLINSAFRYLNRHWIMREYNEGRQDIYEIYFLHLVEWRSVLFNGIQDRLIGAILRIVEKDRCGEIVDTSQIKKICETFVTLGMDEKDYKKSSLDVYRFHFEKPYFTATTEFYRAKSKRFIAENSVSEYMEMVKTCLDKEKVRGELYLHEDSRYIVLRLCNDSLIRDHSVLLQSQFREYLESYRYVDVQLMYDLLSRVVDGINPLRKIFEAHVRNVALSQIADVLDDKQNVDPGQYVNKLFDIYREFQTLTVRAFNSDDLMTGPLIRACKEAFNRNSACGYDGRKSAEMLATYADVLLKKCGTGQEADDREHYLTRISTILKFIKDVDVFQHFYSKKLGRRLWTRDSEFDDIETDMINRLKIPCGISYTNSLRRMIRDMKITKDLETGYREFDTTNENGQLKTIKGTHKILTQNSWPLAPPRNDFIPPEEIYRSCQRFESFYDQKYSGRRLTWLWQHCSGEVVASYCKGQKVPYRFQVSIYQMAILLLFNEADVHTLEEIAIGTQLPPEVLEGQLGVLVDAKILSLGQGVEKNGAKYEKDSKFHLNYHFKSKKIRINLNIIPKTARKQEMELEYNRIQAGRSLQIQAAILRTMKTRKKLNHGQLILECINQIRPHFELESIEVKRCIDVLLDKEYLERLEDDELGYMP